MLRRIEGGMGTYEAPIQQMNGLYRFGFEYSMLVPPSPVAYYTNGSIRPTSETAFRSGATKNVLGNATIMLVPKLTESSVSEVKEAYDAIKALLSFNNAMVGARIEPNMVDIKVPTQPTTSEKGIDIQLEPYFLNIAFTQLWFDNIMSDIQRVITARTWDLNFDRLMMVGLGNMETRFSNLDLPSRKFRFGADSIAELNYKMEPWTKTELRKYMPYLGLLVHALKDFVPSFYNSKSVNGVDPKIAEKYGAPTSDDHYYALASMILWSFGAVGTSIDVTMMRTATDITANIYKMLGLNISVGDPLVFETFDTWVKYIQFTIILGFCLSRNIKALLTDSEIRRIKGNPLTVYADWLTSLEPYSTGKIGHSGDFYMPMPSKTASGIRLPVIVDDRDNATPNILEIIPKLNDRIKFEPVEVRNGEWTSNVMEPLKQDESIILPTWLADSRIQTIEFMERTVIRVRIPLYQRLTGPGTPSDDERRYIFMLNMLSDKANALVEGFRMGFDGLIKIPANIQVFVNSRGEQTVVGTTGSKSANPTGALYTKETTDSHPVPEPIDTPGTHTQQLNPAGNINAPNASGTQ